MPMTDPVYTVSGRYGDVSVTVRADDGDALRDGLVRFLDEASVDVFLEEAFTEVFLGGSEAARAARAVNRSVGATPVRSTGPAVPRSSHVGNTNTVPMQPANPPGVEYPGDCPHGQRTYHDNTLPGQSQPWRRWECAIPWSRQNAQSRCRAVNA